MKTLQVVLVIAVSVALSLVASKFLSPTSPNQSVQKTETSYERILRTQTLRCGYGTWTPGVYKNAETNKMEGLFVELIEEMGRLNGLKIDWTAETDWGQIPESISTGKIDAFCSGMANDAARGKRLAFTNPLSYWAFNILVRADDGRFPAGETIKLVDLNKADYASAYTEGDVLETIVKGEFPLVRGLPLPPLGTPADNLMNVATGKTDFVVFPKILFLAYEKENAGKLRYLKTEPSLRVYGNVIAVGIDDLKLQQLLNAAVNELVYSGGYTKIMSKYEEQYPGAFMRVAPTFVPQ